MSAAPPQLLVDHRDADRGADHDVLPADRIGRADRGDDALRHRHHFRAVVADRGNHRELVAAEPRHQIVAAQRVRQPQRHVADQLVAHGMAERIVDVLEVVEVDIEHRGRRGAGAHFLDHGLEPLAEENTVGQAAERIVHRKVPQPRFAGGDRHRGAPHVAQHEGGEQRKAGKRDGDEGDDAADDLGAGLLRRPGEARDRLALRPVQVIRQIGGRRASRRRAGADGSSCNCAAMPASASLPMNFTDMTIGAASSEAVVAPAGATAAAAMTAGRPATSRITEICGCAPVFRRARWE